MLPTLSEQERAAITVYDEEIASGKIEEYPVWIDDRLVVTFGSLASKGSQEIIDVGCFTGRMVEIAEGLGYSRYLGVDPSKKAVEYCRGKFPKYDFAQGEIRTIGDLFPARFDAFLLISVLMHVPQQALEAGFKSLRRALKLGAVGFVSVPYTDGETYQFTTSYGFEITHYNPREFAIVTECGFKVNLAQLGDGMLFLGLEAV